MTEPLNVQRPTRSTKNFLPRLAAVAALTLTAAALAPLAHRFTQAAPQGAAGDTGVSVESSQQLFATMCALDAAGFNADESTLAEMPSRLKLRSDLLKLQGPDITDLRQFYHDHELADPGETLSRFITFAVVVGPPPRFQFVVDRDVLPPDALAIEGFQEILAAFYKDAHLDRRWSEVQPEYDRVIQRDEPPVRHIVTAANGYLREIYKPKYGHSFTVYVEPLVGKRTNFRNTGDHYSIVIGAGSEFPYDDVQHAYLHFLLDPLPLKFRKEVTAKAALLNIGAKSPRLPAQYRSDFLAYADECLIKAVEMRLNRLKDAKLEAALDEDDQNGFTMVRPLVAGLAKFEKSEPSMSLYFPDLINGIDVPAEQKRLASFAFKTDAEMNAGAAAKAVTADTTTELDRWLIDGNRQIANQDATAATADFEKILEKYPGEPRAYFGLAVASLMNQDADRAQQIFQNLVEAASRATPAAGTTPSQAATAAAINPPDPSVLAWSHVYLGRLHDVADERDQAVVEYRAALAVPGAPEAALVAAQRGVDKSYAPATDAGAKPAAPPKN